MTGAAGGLGLSITRALLQTGADIVAIDYGEEPINSSWGKPRTLPAPLRHLLTYAVDIQNTAQNAGNILTYHRCDISDPEATFSTFEKAIAVSRYPLRGLVHCAGIGWVGPSIDFPIDQARRIIDVNLVGTLICAQSAAKLVQKHDLSASLVFIASMSGYVVNKVGCPISEDRVMLIYHGSGHAKRGICRF